ncbi:MAG: MerR family transcriptional regulator [Oscillospiraceae bacterium]|nr:MerR family transcriptional regulator [Oscillospiraceae bacterium]
MYTIRDLCRISKLSRSAILYYDSLGLLKPVERSTANYRLYSDESLAALNKICLYREAGVSLADIEILLNTPESDNKSIDILEKTLFRINNQMRQVQEMQKTVVEMLKAVNGVNGADAVDELSDEEHNALREKAISMWTFDVLKATGFNEMEDD